MIDNELLLAVVVSVPLFVLIGFTIFDIVRRRDLSAGRKLGWLAVVVFLPGLGMLLYVLVRPLPDPGRNTAAVVGEGTIAFVDMLRQRERGELDDRAFDAEKARLFGEFETG